MTDAQRFEAIRELRAATQAIQVGRMLDALMSVELVAGMLRERAAVECASTLPPHCTESAAE